MNRPDARRILLVHFGQMGDAVMALPAAQALRAAFPRAAITVLTTPAAADVFAMAGLERCWRVDRAAWKSRPARALAGIPALWARLLAARFDLAVDLHSYKETNLLVWAARIPVRVAMLRPTRSLPRLINRKPPPDDTQGRLLDRYCAVLAPLGIAVADRVPRLDPPPAPRAKMAAALRGAPTLGLCPGAGHSRRRWPAARFAALAQRATAAWGARVVAFAGPEESAALLAPLRAAGIGIFTGLSVAELTAALALCRVVVSNPTGPSHLAAAAGASVVTLGEIPMFDPVGRASGTVWPVRAARELSDIGLDAAWAALESAWHRAGGRPDGRGI